MVRPLSYCWRGVGVGGSEGGVEAMSTPYVGFSNKTLGRQPRAKPGDMVACGCGESHALSGGDDGSTVVLFYRCGDKSFLGAVGGRLATGVRADVSGEVDL